MLKGEVVQVAVDAHQLTILEDRLPKQEESSFQKKKNAKVNTKIEAILDSNKINIAKSTKDKHIKKTSY